MEDHPGESLAIFTSGAAVAGKAIQHHKKKMDVDDRQTRFYNPRTGCYSHSKRPLKPKELLEGEARFKKGEDWSEILRDMGLLRY